MMLELSNSEKVRIGRFLEYYRNIKRIRWKDIEKKISTSTYRKIEKGYIPKKEEIYINIFELYGIDFIVKKNFEEWLENYLERLNDVLEWYKENQFNLLIDELERELGAYKSRIVYKQYYEVIHYILDFYKYSKYMSLEAIENYLKLLEYYEFEETIIVYLLEVMFISNASKHASYEIQEQLIKLIKKNENPLFWYLLAFYYKSKGLFDTALDLFEKSFNYWSEIDNKYRYSRSLMGKFVVYKNTDKDRANELATELLDLKENGELNLSMIPSLNFNIGMFYYIDEKYEDALTLFEENLTKYNTFREKIYICSICNRLNISIPQMALNIDYLDDPHRIYLEYFKQKQLGYTNKVLVDYIMQIIVPNKLVNQPYSQPFWKIFEEELLRISLNEKKYATKLVEYMEKKKKVCGNH